MGSGDTFTELPGSAASCSMLLARDALKVGGATVLWSNGDPNLVPGLVTAPDGSLAIDSVTPALWFKSGGVWTSIGGTTVPVHFSVTLVNGDVAPITPGMAVCVQTGTARRCTATLLYRSFALGIAKTGAAPGFPLEIATQGSLTLPAATWDAVTGQVGGLTPQVGYYVQPTPGGLFLPFDTIGLGLGYVGQAVSPTTINISPELPILL